MWTIEGIFCEMKILVVILICIFTAAVLYLLMIMPRIFRKPDMVPFQGWLYAHRGLHCNGPEGGDSKTETGEAVRSFAPEAPENSLRAFQKAVEAGFGIEMDVQLTKDRIPVVFHDFTLKRVCSREGKVCDYTYEELRQFPLYGSDQRIPKFEDVLKLVDGKVPLIVELKIEAADLSVCPAADKLLAEYRGAYCIESFNPLGLIWYRRHRGRVVRGQLAEGFLRKDEFSGMLYLALQNLVFNWLTKPDFIAYNHMHYDMLSRRLCRGLYRNTAVAWTVKSREELEAAGRHFDLFIFDSFVPER